MKTLRCHAFLVVAFCLHCSHVNTALSADEQCPTTCGFTSTQYINSTLTLKILLIEFTDVRHRTSPSTYAKSDFENLLVSSGTYVTPSAYSPDSEAVYGSLRDYYQKMSSGNLTIVGHVINTGSNSNPTWVLLNHTKAYYHSFDYSSSPIFDDAISAAMAQGLDISWSDTVAVIYAGNTYYNFRGLNPMWNYGSAYIMGERHGAAGDPTDQEVATATFSRIGPHCHEFGHVIGIPHSTGSRSDIMDAGRRNGPGGAAPAPLNPIARMLKGWLTPTLITNNAQWDAYYSLTSPQVFRINSSANNDYFLIENRRFDQNMVVGSTSVPDYNTFMPIRYSQNPSWTPYAQGVMVWRVIGGNPSTYGNNGLIYASGIYGAAYPDYTATETDAGDLFPGAANVTSLPPGLIRATLIVMITLMTIGMASFRARVRIRMCAWWSKAKTRRLAISH